MAGLRRTCPTREPDVGAPSDPSGHGRGHGHTVDKSFVRDFIAFHKEILCSDCQISHAKVVIAEGRGLLP
jgi:hypothetical protein